MAWTKEPPKEPGWYWRRKWNGPNAWMDECVRVVPRQYNDGTVVLAAEGDPWNERRVGKLVPRPLQPHVRREWWPTPIQPPETQ